MPGLPIVSGADAVSAFSCAGWLVNRQRGSHVVMIKKGNIASLSIPQHRELAPGTLRALIRASGMTVDQFRSFL